MTLSSTRQRTPSFPSISSLNHASSVRRPPPITTVITSPPWARDEPPSPKDQTSVNDSHLAIESRPSDVASHHSTYASDLGSRWWAFTLPRPREHPPVQVTSSPKSERKGLTFKDRSISWLPTSAIREGTSFSRREKGPEAAAEDENSRDWNLRLSLPPPVAPSFTLAHNITPGWETPWTARVAAQGPRARDNPYFLGDEEEESDDSNKNATLWQIRKKRFRAFILTNAYVPLLFRFVNITFTTSALGVAIRMRQWEMQHNVMGAVGSSPTLVIIFAPLTLVHVMVAIYLEYFGRPLGLWRTSAKLAHTLSEVLFICAWSAALSLCFDNFFTSRIPCAPLSSTAWYNELPRPVETRLIDLGITEGSAGDRICNYMLALICLVGVGLLMYCTNLVISLFRIFEKVKYHPAAASRSS